MAVVLTMIFSFTVLGLVVIVLKASIERFEDNLDKYKEEAEVFWNSTISWIHDLGGEFEDDTFLKAKLGSMLESIAPSIINAFLTMTQTFILMLIFSVLYPGFAYTPWSNSGIKGGL